MGVALQPRCAFCHLPHPKRFRPRPCKLDPQLCKGNFSARLCCGDFGTGPSGPSANVLRRFLTRRVVLAVGAPLELLAQSSISARCSMATLIIFNPWWKNLARKAGRCDHKLWRNMDLSLSPLRRIPEHGCQEQGEEPPRQDSGWHTLASRK